MDIIQSGRKRGCGSCGQSESYELMQFNSILPGNGNIQPFSTDMFRFRNDIQSLLSSIESEMDKELEEERQMEKVGA